MDIMGTINQVNQVIARQEKINDTYLRRIMELEHYTTELEDRIIELEGNKDGR